MKLKYRHAVISFCPDLTDAKAKSVPMAVLLVGDVDGQRFAAAAGISLPPGVRLDPITQEILSDVPHLLRRHVESTLGSRPDATIEELLFALHDSLRNSLVVARVSDEEELPLPQIEEAAVYGQLMNASMMALRVSLHAALPSASPPKQKTAAPPPSLSIWPLGRTPAGFAFA